MTTEIESKWIMIVPIEDTPVYSFACPECMNSLIKFLHDEEWKTVDYVDPIKQCCVCRRTP